MACTVVQGWVPDEEVSDCMACKKPFTQLRRRVSGRGLLPWRWSRFDFVVVSIASLQALWGRVLWQLYQQEAGYTGQRLQYSRASV